MTDIDTASIYPARSFQRGEEGSAYLDDQIDDKGTVVDVKVTRSSGFPALDDASIGAAKNQKWEATTLDGRAVACREQVAVQWQVPLKKIPLGRWFQHPEQVLSMKPEDFPPGAIGKGERGVSGVMIARDTKGVLRDIAVIGPSGYQDLDDAAFYRAISLHATPPWEMLDEKGWRVAWFAFDWRLSDAPLTFRQEPPR